nr:hypothetical protein [Tanacetum cinerariifolium]
MDPLAAAEISIAVATVRAVGQLQRFSPFFKLNFFNKEKASKKERKAYDLYNRCSTKLSRVVSPMRLECIAGH